MSTSVTATLPRNGGAGRSLFSVFSEVFRAMLASRNARVPNAAPAEDMSIWQLYRLTVGYDSISPEVAAELRKKLVGN